MLRVAASLVWTRTENEQPATKEAVKFSTLWTEGSFFLFVYVSICTCSQAPTPTLAFTIAEIHFLTFIFQKLQYFPNTTECNMHQKQVGLTPGNANWTPETEQPLSRASWTPDTRSTHHRISRGTPINVKSRTTTLVCHSKGAVSHNTADCINQDSPTASTNPRYSADPPWHN